MTRNLSRPLPEREGIDLFLKLVSFQGVEALTDFFPGSGRVAEILLSSRLGSGCAYSSVTGKQNEARSGGRIRCLAEDFQRPLSLESASQDLVISFYGLELLPKDELYMALSEARRILKPGGRWAVLARQREKGFLARLAALAGAGKGMPVICMDHFLSPEDWKVLREDFTGGFPVRSRLLLLERTPG